MSLDFTFLKSVQSDIYLYGISVVASFGEYTTLRKRILLRLPHLATDPIRVKGMIFLLMRGDRE